VILDISERKKAEESLIASEIRYRRLFESAKDGILILDAETGKILDANPFIKNLLAYAPEELLGKELWEIGLFKNVFASRENFLELQDHEYICYEDLPLETVNGEIKEVEFISNVYLAGKQKVIQCNIRDITERKQAEFAIQALNAELEDRVAERTLELEIANKELESFAYSVSHDLRAPLRHIDGFAKLLKGKLKTKSDEAHHFLEIIISSSVRMGTMIDNLLNFSRLGRKSLFLVEINLNELIPKVIDQFKPELKNRKITWKLGKFPVIMGDIQLLTLAFENLISNAIKFTSNKENAKIQIGCTEDKSKTCTIFVKDNGAGFDQQFSDKLFGVFQRLHSNEEFEGIGIGLANVKQIVKKHGGSIWAEGKPNEGATFFIKI
jgi:PAS domain S-box-containing protein